MPAARCPAAAAAAATPAAAAATAARREQPSPQACHQLRSARPPASLPQRRRQHAPCAARAVAVPAAPAAAPRSSGGAAVWDVLGLGQVDFAATVTDQELAALAGTDKGLRRVITLEERAAVLSALSGDQYKCNAGGSLSNTLSAISRLGSASDGPALRVALSGSVGADALGEFYRSKMSQAGVNFISPPIPDGSTGTVIVLTTPDAQRTMLSYAGTSRVVAAPPPARVVVVEGYLFCEQSAEAIVGAIHAARAAGSVVALTCADASVVAAHEAGFRAALGAGVDLLFANAAEAEQLAGLRDGCAGRAAKALAADCGVVVVTDGSRGAHVAAGGAGGHVLAVPPHWAPARPVDTCGAGDGFAAGLLYGLLRGAPLELAASFGARTASAVISRTGARLSVDDAAVLAGEFGVLLPVQSFASAGVADLQQVDGSVAAYTDASVGYAGW